MADSAPTFYPCYSYRDTQGAIDFLVNAFGFELLVAYPGEERTITHAELRFGNGVVMLGTTTDERLTSSTYVVVEDADAHCERARGTGAAIVTEPRDTPYGSRDYAARDPEGNTWYFGTYVPDLAAAPA
jgi:uncharacterized glyoxalase superfamily protein PhnB